MLDRGLPWTPVLLAAAKSGGPAVDDLNAGKSQNIAALAAAACVGVFVLGGFWRPWLLPVPPAGLAIALGLDALTARRVPWAILTPALSHFVNCVRLGRPPCVTLRDGAASLAAILAAEQSAESGAAVSLAEVAGPMPLPQSKPDDLWPAPGVPALSVVLVAADGYEGARRVVRHVRQQTIATQIELLLVVPEEADAAPFDESERAGLHSARVVATGAAIPNVDAAAAFGIGESAAPVVASVEDHTYPEPAWAGAILAAYRAPGGPWAAVGSTVLNANPAQSLSWANLLLAYGTWCEPLRAGPVGEVSQHNLSFRRAAIEPLFEGLEERMGRTVNLMQELAARGGRFYIAPDARVHHLNPSRVGSTLALRFHGGRSYGATKASMAGWSPARRAAYAVLSPVIPLLRYRLIGPKAKAAGLRVMPAVALGLVLDGHGASRRPRRGTAGRARRAGRFWPSPTMIARRKRNG